MKKDRILFVAFQSPHRSNGGMESATMIYESLADCFDWSLSTTRESAFTSRWRSAGAKVSVSNVNDGDDSLGSRAQRLRWSLAIIVELLRDRPKFVHANDIRAYQAAATPCFLLNIPIVLTIRDTKPETEKYGLSWQLAALQCAALVTLSEEMRAVISNRVSNSVKKISVINSIVDSARFRPADSGERESIRNQLKIKNGEFSVGVVGAVQPKKEQLSLINNCLPSFLEQCPDAHVHFLGDCDVQSNQYAHLCMDAVRSRMLEGRVTFHGHIDRVSEWYRALDIVLIASKREGLARCMIESMACGLPALSVAVCSAKEMLEDTGAGRVVPLGDSDALCRELLDLWRQPKVRDQMGGAGRVIAHERFSRQVIVDQYRSFYSQVIT